MPGAFLDLKTQQHFIVGDIGTYKYPKVHIVLETADILVVGFPTLQREVVKPLLIGTGLFSPPQF